jgi:hypothetical protein
VLISYRDATMPSIALRASIVQDRMTSCITASFALHGVAFQAAKVLSRNILCAYVSQYARGHTWDVTFLTL